MNKFIRHDRCDKCGSSDALSIYIKDDGNYQAHCFSCQKSTQNYNSETIIKPKANYKMKSFLTIHDILNGPIADKKSRGIPENIVSKFGIRATVNQTTGAQDTHYYPYYIDNELSGYKARVLPKDFTSIGAIGNIKGVELFGQNLCRRGGYKLVITEGEEDCLATYRILSEYAISKGKNIEPNVVSLISGVSSAAGDIEKNWDFVDSFKEVIFCLDQDKAGKEGLKKIAHLLTQPKFKIMTFSKKDASEMLKAGLQGEFISSFFNAGNWKPDGIKNIEKLWDIVSTRVLVPSTPYPDDWIDLNKMTYGRRLGELDTWTAGSGAGKTQVLRELQYWDILTTDFKIGIIALEEPMHDTVEALMGLSVNSRIHLPNIRANLTQEMKKEAFDNIASGNRVEIYDHFGSVDDMSLLSKIRYMAAGLGCKHIYLDHLSIVVSESADVGDERKRIDALMSKLKNLTQELNIWIGLVVHLRKTSGTTPFELGAIPDEDSLRGSGSIKQLSNGVFAVQRNKRHSTDTMRDVLQIHVLKNRYVGREGPADFLRFDQETGRLIKISPPTTSILEPKKKGSGYKSDDNEAF